MNKIFLVSHCVLNVASKVKYHNKLSEPTEEELMRRKFLELCKVHDCQLIQLPCPEFLLYGSKRWGHTKTQFEHPMFKQYSQEILQLFVRQIEEYRNDESTEILGIVGINGSPSCGIDYTYIGEWGGELSSCSDIPALLECGKPSPEKGVFMEVFEGLLKEKQMELPFYALTQESINKIEVLLKGL